MKKTLNFGFLMLIVLLSFLLIALPEPCRQGAVNGILLCGRVIIPSLFPFTMCVLFITKSGALKRLERFSSFTQRLFGLNAEELSVVILSCIGGYPIGAKLLNGAAKEERISPERAGVMLNFCVNAGPAFVISAVGSGILSSRRLGVILLVSHISSSLALMLLLRLPADKALKMPKANVKSLSFADSFVSSAAEASETVFGICGFTVLFSCINSYLLYFGEQLPVFRAAVFALEVTNGVLLTKNVYLISFLLGFGGFSVWCQVFSVSGIIKKNYLKFAFSRIAHGILSSVITFVLVKVFGVAVSAFSNNRMFSFEILYSSPQVGISLLAMGIIFAISLSSEKTDCKLLDDMV